MTRGGSFEDPAIFQVIDRVLHARADFPGPAQAGMERWMMAQLPLAVGGGSDDAFEGVQGSCVFARQGKGRDGKRFHRLIPLHVIRHGSSCRLFDG